MEKSSGSGITLTLADGTEQTLEEVLDEEQLREVAKNREGENRFKFYHRPHIRLASSKGTVRKRTRIYSQVEVAKLNWERRKMKVTLENLTSSVCELLATGEAYTTKEMHEKFEEKGVDFSLQQLRTRVNFMHYQTRFEYAIKGSKKVLGALNYQIQPAASDLTAKELELLVYSKSRPAEYKEMLKGHPALAAFIKSQEEAEPQKKEEKKEIKQYNEEKKQDTRDVVNEETETTLAPPGNVDLNEKIAEAIAQQLGVKVEVTGRVEVVFKFG